MTENVENLVFEHLRHIRGRVDQMAVDLSEVKQRLSGLEQPMTLTKREINLSDEAIARQQVSIDRLSERMTRVEQRLDLVSE